MKNPKNRGNATGEPPGRKLINGLTRPGISGSRFFGPGVQILDLCTHILAAMASAFRECDSAMGSHLIKQRIGSIAPSKSSENIKQIKQGVG